MKTIVDVKKDLNRIPKNIRVLLFGSYGVESIFGKYAQSEIEKRILKWDEFVNDCNTAGNSRKL